MIVENLGKMYGNHVVFQNAEFTIKRGEKVAFVGKNGEGKSTLVKCIMGEIPFSGHLKLGHNVKIGYFAQNQAQMLDESISVFDTIDNVATGDIRTKIRDILGAFMFGGENSEKKVKVLSGGEKTRLAMIKLLLEPVNFLILDEPTNHLDMRTKDILKDAIKDFDGTVIVVSHDREFLDGLVDKVYEFGGGKVKENIGGIYDFLKRKNLSSLNELEKSVKTQNNDELRKIDSSESTSKNLSYTEQKEREKILKRAEKSVKLAEDNVCRLEEEQAKLESKLSSGQSDSELLKAYSEIIKKLEEAMSEWENAQENFESLSKNAGK